MCRIYASMQTTKTIQADSAFRIILCAQHARRANFRQQCCTEADIGVLTRPAKALPSIVDCCLIARVHNRHVSAHGGSWIDQQLHVLSAQHSIRSNRPQRQEASGGFGSCWAMRSGRASTHASNAVFAVAATCFGYVASFALCSSRSPPNQVAAWSDYQRAVEKPSYRTRGVYRGPNSWVLSPVSSKEPKSAITQLRALLIFVVFCLFFLCFLVFVCFSCQGYRRQRSGDPRVATGRCTWVASSDHLADLDTRLDPIVCDPLQVSQVKCSKCGARSVGWSDLADLL
jgi:hypothetical protein